MNGHRMLDRRRKPTQPVTRAREIGVEVEAPGGETTICQEVTAGATEETGTVEIGTEGIETGTETEIEIGAEAATMAIDRGGKEPLRHNSEHNHEMPTALLSHSHDALPVTSTILRDSTVEQHLVAHTPPARNQISSSGHHQSNSYELSCRKTFSALTLPSDPALAASYDGDGNTGIIYTLLCQPPHRGTRIGQGVHPRGRLRVSHTSLAV